MIIFLHGKSKPRIMKKHYPTYALLLFLFVIGCSKDDNGTDPYKKPNSNNPIQQEPVLSSAKQIVSFKLVESEVPCAREISNVLDEAGKSIEILVPYYTGINSITPVVTLSEGATISPQGAIDFTESQTYTVSAEDGTSVDYEVHVTVGMSDRQVLEMLLAANPDNRTNWNTSQPDMSSWNGVVTNQDDRVLELSLIQAGITTLPAEIGQLCLLESLSVSNNAITEIPSEIGQLQNLKFLRLNNLRLTSLPAEIGSLSQLTYFSARGNDLEALPAEIGQLSALETLNLSSNRLTSLPAEIGGLTSLKSMDMGGNRITAIPGEIGQMSKLETLTLSSNRMTELPGQIGQLSSLKDLIIDRGDLASLPTEIGQLSNLRSLIVSRNKLITVPAELGNATNLAYFNAQRNNIDVVPKEVGNLINLNLLVLRRNDFNTIPSEICALATNYGTRIFVDGNVDCMP